MEKKLFNKFAKKFKFTESEKNYFDFKNELSVVGILLHRNKKKLRMNYSLLNQIWEVLTEAKKVGASASNIEWLERKYNQVLMQPNLS